MKMAEISPVFKRNDHLQKDNYRPVSILSTFSKLLEQQMAKQLQTHFEVLFNEYVSAYRNRYSWRSGLLDLIDQWRFVLDNKFYVALFSWTCPNVLILCRTPYSYPSLVRMG